MQGKTGFADIMFLVAFILFLIETLIRLVRPAQWAYDSLLLCAGLACVALGFLAL
jgi:hypothetical protein